MVIAFCRRRWIFETFDLREGPLIVSTLTSGPCSVFITNLKPLRRSLRTSNRRINISPSQLWMWGCWIIQPGSQSSITLLGVELRSSGPTHFYGFLCCHFFEGLSDVLTAFMAVEHSEKSQDTFIPHHLVTMAHLCLNQHKSKNNLKFWVLYLKHFNFFFFCYLSEPWDDSDTAPKGLIEKTWGNDTEWGPITCVNNFHEANFITGFPHQWTIALACRITGANCKMLR